MHIGILAGIWPCGIVTLLSELFIAESKSQVYGALHSFFLNAPNAAARISKSYTYNNEEHHFLILYSLYLL